MQTTEQTLWQAFVEAWAKYDAAQTAENWIAKNLAYNEWAKAFLEEAA